MTLVGDQGRTIPMPPDLMVTKAVRFWSVVRQSFGIAAVMLIIVLVRILPEYHKVLAAGWLEVGRRCLLIVPTAFLTGVLISTLCTVAYLPSAPWMRRSLGRKIERQVAALGDDQLEEEIELARTAIQQAPAGRFRDACEAWLRWLVDQRRTRRPRALRRATSIQSWTLRPRLAPQIVLGVIGIPFLALGAWVLMDAAVTARISLVTAASAIGVMALGLWLLGEVSTVRIVLTPERLSLRRLFRTRWSIARTDVEVREGAVGGAEFPGLRVFSHSTGRKIGEIASAQFREIDLEKLAALFPPRR